MHPIMVTVIMMTIVFAALASLFVIVNVMSAVLKNVGRKEG